MSMSVRSVLLATDFSACAARAHGYAVMLAGRFRARLDVVHVLEFYPGLDPEFPVNSLYLEQLRKETDARLQELVAQAQGQGLRANGLHVTGIPSQQISDVAMKFESDLIVMGTHGLTGLEHILLGSTAERVIKGAPCPVMTVRGPLGQGRVKAASVDGATIAHLLLALDFSDCAMEAYEYAVMVAKHVGCRVTLLHVLEPIAFALDFTLLHATEGHRRREQAQGRLAELAGLLSAEGVRTDTCLRGGLPVDGILEVSGERGCDLIVMGTHGRRGMSHVVSGSIAEAVLRRAECPVMTVKSPKFRRAHHP